MKYIGKYLSGEILLTRECTFHIKSMCRYMKRVLDKIVSAKKCSALLVCKTVSLQLLGVYSQCKCVCVGGGGGGGGHVLGLDLRLMVCVWRRGQVLGLDLRLMGWG